MDVVTVSINESPEVTGATGQKLVADSVITEVNPEGAEWIIIPGGVPGAPNLHGNAQVNKIIVDQWNAGGGVAAICAGPAIVVAST